MYPEYRWSEHVREHEESRLRSHSALVRRTSVGVASAAASGSASASGCGSRLPRVGVDRDPQPLLVRCGRRSARGCGMATRSDTANAHAAPPEQRLANGRSCSLGSAESEQLPFLALNDVFIGESLSSRSAQVYEFDRPTTGECDCPVDRIASLRAELLTTSRRVASRRVSADADADADSISLASLLFAPLCPCS